MRADDRATDGLGTDDLVEPRRGGDDLEERPAEDSRRDGPRSQEEPVPALFRPEQVTEFRTRWQDVQTSFVDDPQRTLRDADQLVAEVMQALASTFADHKHGLEAQWQRGGEVATEDLRLALRRYRTFFNELLRS
ncbi:hypothetical protein GCM10027445_63790 [Amycolatopsis endophytica]|uniref:Uncharacterized protein n=1 Tax=Amycolatopsis endophytica TaxID=860233 RepID=A0A853BDR7_9PSEU|nr:hypothetical protein [Amycolatopsis endophytica]NYI92884.1 hypothetical protein [Amycolatopsis endophytica]